MILHSFSKLGSDADKDWKFILLIFIGIFVGAVILNINIFIEAKSQMIAGQALAPEEKDSLNSKALSKAISLYDLRAKDYERLASSSAYLVDPAR